MTTQSILQASPTSEQRSRMRTLLQTLNGAASVILFAANTAVMVWPLFVASFLKAAIPIPWWRRALSRATNGFAEAWIAINSFNIWWTKSITWEVTGLSELKMTNWYLVLSNHQSWADIVILQKIFLRRIPFLKFFLKKELIWVPLLGLAWWALDFPFMKRYSSSFIEKNPHLKGKDMEITKKACEKFKTIPVSVMNFVEGTRLTPDKHRRQQSPFENLLKPKAGGAGFILTAMGERIDSILDVTIMYPPGAHSFWDFLCGRIRKVTVQVETIPVTQELLGDYINDEEYRDRFQAWLNALWARKDQRLQAGALGLGGDDAPQDQASSPSIRALTPDSQTARL